MPEPEALDLPEDLQLDDGEAKEDGPDEDNPFDIDAMKGMILSFYGSPAIFKYLFRFAELMPPEDGKESEENNPEKKDSNTDEQTDKEPDEADDEVGTKQDEENVNEDVEENANEDKDDTVDDGTSFILLLSIVTCPFIINEYVFPEGGKKDENKIGDEQKPEEDRNIEDVQPSEDNPSEAVAESSSAERGSKDLVWLPTVTSITRTSY